jgi:hypothetical protein
MKSFLSQRFDEKLKSATNRKSSQEGCPQGEAGNTLRRNRKWGILLMSDVSSTGQGLRRDGKSTQKGDVQSLTGNRAQALGNPGVPGF